MTILPIGGRIKAASIGLDHLSGLEAGEVDRAIYAMRKEPPSEFMMAFFPRDKREIQRTMCGIGIFRPMLKTDQGMPGNFVPFAIDPAQETTDLGTARIGHEECVTVEERWCDSSSQLNGTAVQLHEALLRLDLEEAREILESLKRRRAEKGRLPYFFIRPALVDRDIVLGEDIPDLVELMTASMVRRLAGVAERHEQEATGSIKPLNLIYAQPDVYVLRDGTCRIERLNCPDVGFFLTKLPTRGSAILPRVSGIVRRMLDAVARRINERMGEDITIVTRDEVLASHEDVLELYEIEALSEALQSLGARVNVVPVSTVEEVAEKSRLLLLNIDYRAEGARALLRRHAQGTVTCFPNPFFQRLCQEETGLTETVLDPTSKYGARFLSLARSEPKNETAALNVLRQIDNALTASGQTCDIMHVALPSETVPVFRRSMHAWRQLAARAARPENAGILRFRGIPAAPGNLLITSSTGPRLHAFRFMYVT